MGEQRLTQTRPLSPKEPLISQGRGAQKGQRLPEGIGTARAPVIRTVVGN